MNKLINRNEDFSEELELKKFLYHIEIKYHIDEDCDPIDIDITFEQINQEVKIDKIINASKKDYVDLEFYTKDKSKLMAAEQEMLNIVYDKINDFINEYASRLKPYKDLLNNYYRNKKLSRVLNDPTEIVTSDKTTQGKI